MCDMGSIGDRLKKVRKTLKKSQQEFSDIIGVKRTTYTGYENGTEIPMYVLKSLQYKYMLNLDYLVNGDGEMFDNNFDDSLSSDNQNSNNMELKTPGEMFDNNFDDSLSSDNLNSNNMELKTLLDVIKRQNAMIDNLEKKVAQLEDELGVKNERTVV